MDQPQATKRALLLAAIIGGVLFGLSQPLVIGAISETPIDPTGLSGLLVFVAFIPVLRMLRGGGPKRAYWTGFFMLYVGFTIVINWLMNPLTVFAKFPIPLAFIALSILTAAMSFYVSSAFAVAVTIRNRFSWSMVWVFPMCLCTAEFFRNSFPVGGFPWANAGYSLATVPVLLQGASAVGVYGLVFLIAFVNAALEELWFRKSHGASFGDLKRLSVVLVAVVAVWLGYGSYRLATEPDDLKTVKVGLIQGNIEQGVKNKARQNANLITDRYHRLQKQAFNADVDVVVWPEAALPVSMRTSQRTMVGTPIFSRETNDKLKARDPSGMPQNYIIGAVARGRNPAGKTERFNTALVGLIDAGGVDLVGRFDKSHLVPFGEYVPFPIDAIIGSVVPVGSTTSGYNPKPMPLKTASGDVLQATTICYEGIFPEITRGFTNAGAEIFFNVTNDAWYGVSSAAIQHLRMYSMRAVESGRAVARVANTGISAWVDTRGELHQQTGLYEEAVVIADVPISNETTIYAFVGDIVALLSSVFAIGAWIYALLGAYFWQRQRGVAEWVTGGVGVLIFAGLLIAFKTNSEFNNDEAWLNYVSVGGVAALIAGVGALSGRRWGRKAQLYICGSFFLFTLLGALMLKSILAGAFALICAVFFALSFRRRNAYTREADANLDSAMGK